MKNLFASVARVVLAVAFACPALGWAQGYPVRPIHLVVPYPPGGGVDVAGRLVAKGLSERLGQPVLVDNRPGAGTVLGAAVVANAAADGYTLLISSGSTFTINPALNQKLPYDPIKSFEPLGITARVPLILLAHPSVAANNFGQLVRVLRATPDQFVYGSFGNGTTGHLAGEMLWQRAGVKVKHIPYKGSAQAMTDLIGGQIPLTVDAVASALPQLKAGKVKAIAVLGAARVPQLPQVPTIAESGYAEFDADSWLAVVAPRGLPSDVRAALENAVADTARAAALHASLVASGLQSAYESGDGVSARIEVELPRMRATVQRAGIQN